MGSSNGLMLSSRAGHRRLMLLLALLTGLLLIAGAMAGPSASAASGFKYKVEQGAFSAEVTPYAGGGTPVAAFYSYGVPCGASSNTGLEISQTSQLFLYSGPGGLSLVVIHDRPEACLGEVPADGGQVGFTYAGLPVGAAKVLGDDPPEGNIPNASWLWFPCCTDGHVISLPEVCDFEFTIDPNFINGIDRWASRSGPAGGDIADFPNLVDPVTIKCIRTVDVDIKPGSDPNGVNPNNNGVIPVAILSDAGFDASDVDPATLQFGPAGALVAHNGHLEDVNNDGLVDMLGHFRTRDTGIAPGDTEACITGTTFGGLVFEGCDAIKTVP